MSKVKVKGREYDEAYIASLIKNDEGAIMKDAIWAKQCGNCNNNLVQPYHFCRFCGSRVVGHNVPIGGGKWD